MFMRKWLLILLGLAVLALGCSTLRLERRLDAQAKDWYWQHWPLMEGRVPGPIDNQERIERVYFLRLPTELRDRYQHLFWAMRDEEVRKVYEERLRTVTRLYREPALPGWMSDRGKVYLICGQPDYIEDRGEDAYNFLGSSIEGWKVEHWNYQRGAMLYDVYFVWKSDRWVLDFYSVTGVADFRQLWEACLKEFSVGEDGWNLWAGELRSYELAKK
jgi:GWxTD domain-containing protein